MLRTLLRRLTRIHREEQAASLMAATGVIWVVKIVTEGTVPRLVFPPGPLEICGISVLIWLHAKWRRSIRAS